MNLSKIVGDKSPWVSHISAHFRNKGTGYVFQGRLYSKQVWKKDNVFFQSKEQNYLLHSIIKIVSPSGAEFRLTVPYKRLGFPTFEVPLL